MLAVVKPAVATDSAWTRPPAGAIAWWWAAVTVYACAIFLASSTHRPLGIQDLPPGVDKVIHAAVFGGLSLTVWKALRCSAPRLSRIRLSVLAGLIATLYGVSDEIHQWFVPGREMDIFDVVADGIGAFAAQGALLVLRPAVPRPERSASAQ